MFVLTLFLVRKEEVFSMGYKDYVFGWTISKLFSGGFMVITGFVHEGVLGFYHLSLYYLIMIIETRDFLGSLSFVPLFCAVFL